MHDEHPISLVVDDDLVRSRLTVFFRLLLALPHIIWIFLWSIVVVAVAIAGWLAALATGRLPRAVHRFLCAYVRYTAHLTAYVSLVANPFPGFSGAPRSYPIDVDLPSDPELQERGQVLIRLLLAVPALLVSVALGGGTVGVARTRSSTASTTSNDLSAGGLSGAIALLGWFASLATARMPRGLRDAGAYAVGYRAQTLAYALLVTPRYPNADPTAMLARLERPPVHPVRIVGDSSDLHRSRLTVFFRLVLAIPHLVWLGLWTIAAIVASIVQWVVIVARGRPAESLHAFLTRFVRYAFHVATYVYLVANPFPGFFGDPGEYPLDLELPPPAPQDRAKTAFRIFLALPAVIVNSALGSLLFSTALLSWFASLANGSAPEGLRNASAYAVRYGGQTYAYVFLLTDVYPNASPLEGSHPGDPFDAVPPDGALESAGASVAGR